MNRRVLIVVVRALLAAGVAFAVYQIELQRQRSREQVQEAIRIASEKMGSTLSKSMASMSFGPKLEWRVKLEGDVTTVTFTVSNASSSSYKDIRFDGLVLGGVEPRETATLPVRIAELAPGKSHGFVLHYDHLQWLGDDVPENRIDMNWAEKPLDLSNSWVAVWDTKSDESDPNVTVKTSESKGSSSSKGVPIRLDEKDACELKSRRDAAWKAKPKH